MINLHLTLENILESKVPTVVPTVCELDADLNIESAEFLS